MSSKSSSIQQVVNDDLQSLNANELVTVLLTIEKQARKDKTAHSLADIVGCWNLRFITGTKKSRKRAGAVLGAGKYIPKLIKIQLQYESNGRSLENQGRVRNSVQIGFLRFSLTGPVKFFPVKDILAFDFTYLEISLFSRLVYGNYIKDGLKRDTEFELETFKNQAFFSYFLIQDQAIAARGKGGGLALWKRAD